MCAKGTSFGGNAHFDAGGYEFMDVYVIGTNNETTLGEKIETCAGFRGEGVGGIKTEVIAGAEFAAVGGLKFDYNYGMKYDYSFGYKFGRSPIGTVEAVGDFFHWNNSHTMTVGTSFFVGAGLKATIHAGTIDFAGTSSISLLCCGDPTVAARTRTTLAMTTTNAALTYTSPTLTSSAAFSLTTQAALVAHPVGVNIACGAAATAVSIALAPGLMSFNADATQLNGNNVLLGMPPTFDATVTAQLAALAAESAALLALVDADVAAANAASAAAAAADDAAEADEMAFGTFA